MQYKKQGSARQNLTSFKFTLPFVAVKGFIALNVVV